MDRDLWHIIERSASWVTACTTGLGFVAALAMAFKTSSILRFLITRATRTEDDEAALIAEKNEKAVLVASIAAAVVFGIAFISSIAENVSTGRLDYDMQNRIASITPPAHRHVSVDDRKRFAQAIGLRVSSFQKPTTVEAVDTAEATGYAVELMLMLNENRIRVITNVPGMSVPVPFAMRALDAEVRGVFFQVHDVSNPPELTKVLASTFLSINIKTYYIHNTNLALDDYVLTVGLQ